MLKNYFKTAWRTIRRRPVYAAINVGGLAVGLAACFLIALFVQDELSYDDFHENAERTYRVAYHAETAERSRERLFATLAVLLGCLGLFGLAAYAAEARRKEIGIRKALGASARSVVTLLSKDFLKYVATGFALAVPVAWYGMHRWLEDFAYRIEIGPGVFALAGALVLAVALAVVGTQALRAARTNPAEALRDE